MSPEKAEMGSSHKKFIRSLSFSIRLGLLEHLYMTLNLNLSTIRKIEIGKDNSTTGIKVSVRVNNLK
jgi:hypothetical protein